MPQHTAHSRAALLAAGLLCLSACGASGSPESADARSTPAAAEQSRPAVASSAPAFSAQAIERAEFRPGMGQPAPATAAPGSGQSPSTPGQTAPAQPDPAIVRAQILLDRARFSPGIVDGFGGDNTSQAVAAYERANGLRVDGQLDADVFERLTSSDQGPALTRYAITDQDLAGPFIGRVPTDLEELAALPAPGYASVVEMLAERFHMTEGLLRALNPGVSFTTAGEAITVARVSGPALAADVARIELTKADSALRAFDAEGRLLLFAPATIGSDERPAPTGTLTVNGVAPEPDYTYDPERLSYGDRKRRLTVKAGPNNPVGSVWIDLSKDTYGIHGTPDPSKIAKTQSNGCIRLTNWTAEALAARVKPGVQVVIR